MAIKGLTTPVIGDYSESGNTVTYSNAIVANKRSNIRPRLNQGMIIRSMRMTG